MEMTLQEMLAIVESDFVREMWKLVAIVSLHLFAFFGIVALSRFTGAATHLISALRRHPVQNGIAVVLAIPLFIYGATKAALLVPHREQCDYRIQGAQSPDVTDGWLGYVRMTGDTFPTNILVACCDGAVTNEMTFTHNGQFYIETIQYQNLDLTVNSFWVRDSETNDWTRAVADIYSWEMSEAVWVSGWRAEIAHLPNYEDPKAYRFWFIGPEENLPEKIIEGGIGIVVDECYRDAHHIHIRFHSDDPDLRGKMFTLQVRTVTVVDGVEVLGDWQTLATTYGDVFDVSGNFVQSYNRMRIFADKGNE